MRTIPTIKVSADQYTYALKLTEISLSEHKTPNAWDNTTKANKTLQMRFVGLLGEVVFADLFGLPRPQKAYGATDGQDNGSDFTLAGKHIDIKTMRRTHGKLRPHYVFNISPRQLHKRESKTNIYVFISIFGDAESGALFAQFAGKANVENVKGWASLCTVASAQRGDGSKVDLSEPVIAVPISLMEDFRVPPAYKGAIDLLKINIA